MENKNDTVNIHRIWGIMFVLFSLAMIIAMPISRVPDEIPHFRQAFVIADGQWLSSIRTRIVEYPENIRCLDDMEISVTELIDLIKTESTSGSFSWEIGTNTAIYPPVNYFPQAIGIKLASMFTDNGLLWAYSARITNWLCTAAILCWALKRLPCYKHLMFFLTLMPMNLQEMISVSADGMTTAIVFALTAFILNARYWKKAFSMGDYCALTLLSIGVVCWKVMYFPMLFMLLLIPEECFLTPKHRKLTVTALIGGGIGLLILWGIFCYFFLFTPAAEGSRASTTLLAMTSFLDYPVDFCNKFIHSLYSYGPSYIKQIFGGRLSYLDIQPSLFWVCASIVVCVLFVLADDSMTLNIRERLGICVPSFVSILVMFLMLYLWWTPEGSMLVEGIQGRYFMPLMLGGLIAVKPTKTIGKQLLPILYLVNCLVYVGYLYDILKITF